MITSLYAIPIAIVFLVLSLRVVRYRRANQLGLGDYGDKSLLKRMRAQANCAEYAPFGLVLMALAELSGATPWVMHLIGATLLLGRLGHGIGFSASPPRMILRVWGMLFTFAAYGVAIIALGVVTILG